MRRLLLSMYLLISTVSQSRAETINMSCDAVTGGGAAIKTYIQIDTDRKYVRLQEPKFVYEYQDGRSGNALGPNGFGMTAWGKQFVVIDQRFISFGLRSQYTNTIDRQTGMITYTDDTQYPCVLLKSPTGVLQIPRI